MKYIPTLLITLIVASAVLAAPARRSPRQDMVPPQVLAEFLDLTAAQREEVKTFHETLRTTVEPLREQQRELREKVRTAVGAGNAEDAGELLIAEKALREQFKAAHDVFATSFASILTPEQKAKWDVVQELKEARRQVRR